MIKSSNILIEGVKPLLRANRKEITILDNHKYAKDAIKTKAGFCITTKKLSKFLPTNVEQIIADNVLKETALLLIKIYPDANIDYPDPSLKLIKKSLKKEIEGINFFLGKNVKIGKGTFIGTNTIIEHDVQIGRNCIIGSNVVLKNCIIGKNVTIQDGCKIGQKGFGFLPNNIKNIKFPHIGSVIISDHVEIASGCTIDRGSIDNTFIGKNTYLDNQVHVAHNVKIGNNCMIAGQVGFAGSSKIGDNVSIGGQAGISGHLKIGNNVKIGGGSGVIKDIQDNEIVMGYPAVSFKKFIKQNKK